jgi:hypothetical protein
MKQFQRRPKATSLWFKRIRNYARRGTATAVTLWLGSLSGQAVATPIDDGAVSDAIATSPTSAALEAPLPSKHKRHHKRHAERPPYPVEETVKLTHPKASEPETRGAEAAAPRAAFGHVELKGRVVGRAELRAQRGTVVNAHGELERGLIKSLDLAVRKARIDAAYTSPLPWLKGVVKLELAHKPRLKDGYAQAKVHRFAVRLGQFKMPTSVFETTSSLTLPLARRGSVSSLLKDWLDVGGRRPGVMLGYQPHLPLHPSFSVGAFQAGTATEIIAGSRDTDLLARRSADAQSYVARVEVESKPLTFGAWYEHRLGSPALLQTARYATAGADLVLERAFAQGGLRLWLDGIIGKSWYRNRASSGPKEPTFASARLLAAYRIFGTSRGELYLEPFGLCGLFEPDLALKGDLSLETAVGFNVGAWRRAHLTFELESVRAERYFPTGSDGYLAGEVPNYEALLVQATAAF